MQAGSANHRSIADIIHALVKKSKPILVGNNHLTTRQYPSQGLRMTLQRLSARRSTFHRSHVADRKGSGHSL